MKQAPLIRRMIESGVPNIEISRRLNINLSTISYHAKILGKRKFTFSRTKRDRKCPRCNRTVKVKNAKFCGSECYIANRYYEREQKIVAGTATPKQMKMYLLEKFGNRCMSEMCQWNFEAQPINCELEHSDGNSENNTLENCKLICPNCHSLTPTYKVRNRGNGRHFRRQRYAEGKSY